MMCYPLPNYFFLQINVQGMSNNIFSKEDAVNIEEIPA